MYNVRFISGKTLAIAASLALLAACGGGDDDVVATDTTSTTSSSAGSTSSTSSTSTSTTTSSTVGSTTTTTVVAASVRLDNFGRGWCVTEDAANRVVAAQNCFANVANDNWSVIGYADNKIALQNTGTGRCVTVSALAATPAGGDAVTVPCDGSAQTLFTQPASTAVAGGFNLRNEASTQCLEISAANDTAGGRVTQWTCGANVPHQTWTTTAN